MNAFKHKTLATSSECKQVKNAFFSYWFNQLKINSIMDSVDLTRSRNTQNEN